MSYQIFRDFLSNTILVHIYSYPSFTTETFTGLLICLVHCLLIIQIGKTINKLGGEQPIKVPKRRSISELDVRSSTMTAVVRNHPELGVDIIFKDNSLLKNDWDTLSKINKMLSTSISECIKLDMEKLKKQLQLEHVEGPLVDVRLRPSVEELCNYLLLQKEINTKVISEPEPTDLEVK